MTMFCFIASLFAQQCLLLNVKHPVVKHVPECQIFVLGLYRNVYCYRAVMYNASWVQSSCSRQLLAPEDVSSL